MSNWESIQCCHRLYSLLKKQSPSPLKGSLGFPFRDDGLFISSRNENDEIISVRVVNIKRNLFLTVLPDTGYASLNLKISNLLKLAASNGQKN